MKVFLSNFIRLFVCSFILCIQPFCLHAQTTVLTQSFKNITDETSYTAISSYNGWSFENCYAAGKVNGVDHFLQVGSGSSPYKLGSVTSPVLGVEGNVVVLVRTSRITIGAKFCVSVEGTGIVSSTEYTIEEGSFYHPSAILIKGCLPSTRIRIEGTNGKFYLQMTKASVVSDAVFYESFDFMNGNGGNDDTYSVPSALVYEEKANIFDNYSGIDFSGVYLGDRCIEINVKDNYYTTPTFPTVTNSMLLSFRIAGTNSSDGTPLAVELSGGGSMSTTSFDVVSATWKKCYAVVSDMTTSSRFTFTGKKVFLDDVMLTPINSGLDQSKDNTAYIEANADQVRTVTITRTLTSGIWCPLCLPFDVTPNQMATEIGTTCEIRTLSSIETSTGVFRFNSVEGTTTIEAGTPFLVKLTATVANPTFSSVAIKNTDPMSYSNGDYQFVGIYSPTYLETDGTNLFLGIDGNLYKPGTGEGENRLGGMRAYFVVPEKASARVAIFDEPTTDGINVLTEMSKAVVYDLQGRRIDSSKANHGLYVRGGRKWIVK